MAKAISLSESKSFSKLEEQIRAAVQEKYKPKKSGKSECCPIGGAWVKTCFPKYVIVEHEGKHFAHSYSFEKGECKIGEGVEVEAVWRPVSKKDIADWQEAFEKLFEE